MNGIIYALCMKGEKMYCANYVVVTLYIVAYYTLSRVLYYTEWPKKFIHFLLINIFGINLNEICISG